MVRVGLVVLLAVGLGLTGCSDDAGAPSGTQVMSSMSSSVSSAFTAAVPSVGPSGSSLSLRTTDEWKDVYTGLKALGDGGSADIAPRNYVDQLFDPNYAVGDFAPTLFGRFAQEMEVVSIIASQIPFVNGVPSIGSWPITTEIYINDVATTVTFTVVVEESTDSRFDVKFYVNETFLKYYGAMRNDGTEINFVGAEASEDTRRGMSILFLNTNTGKLSYTFAAKQNSGPTIEFHRLFVEGTGGNTYVAHVYKESGNEHKVVAAASAGQNSTEFTVSFEKTNTNAFAAQTWCVNAVDALASSNTDCGSITAPTLSGINTLISEIDGYSDAKAMTEAKLGTDLSTRDSVVVPFDTGSMANFLTTL